MKDTVMHAEIKIVIRILPLPSRNLSLVMEDSCKLLPRQNGVDLTSRLKQEVQWEHRGRAPGAGLG